MEFSDLVHDVWLDIWKQIEVFVVFVDPAFPGTDELFGFNELDALDPLHHLVAKLVLDPQTERRPIHRRERLAIHRESQQALGL